MIRIWKHDPYDLRKYTLSGIDYFLDIGACIGAISVFFKALEPTAKVIAIEPCLKDYEALCNHCIVWGIRCYNIALGNGKPLYFQYRGTGTHRCYTEKEKELWEPKGKVTIPSMTLSEMFQYFGIKGKYIIKIDTEGGERFLLEDEKAFEIIKGAVQFNVELHRDFGGTLEQWADWFDLFKDTHKLYASVKIINGEKLRIYDEKKQQVYQEIDKPIKKWRNEYMLVKK